MADSTLSAAFGRITSLARKEGRASLTEIEGLAMLAAMGIDAPRHHFVRDSNEYAAIAAEGSALLPGERAVVKVISPEILHKTEIGGVAIIPNDTEEILAAIRGMESRFSEYRVQGYTVNEFVAFDPKFGHEMLFGYRFAPDFGPVINFGPGGIFTEYLSARFKPGAATVCISPETATRESIISAVERSVVYGVACAGLRNTKPAIDREAVVDALMKFSGAAEALAAAGVAEFEVNPMVIRGEGESASLLALDCLVTLRDFAAAGLEPDARGVPHNAAQAARPVGHIGKILKPASAAIIGVSEKGMNNGRIILRNLIENGFDTSRIYIIKAGIDSVDGCKCVPDVADLPEKVDLFVLVIPAAGTPETLARIAELDKAWSVIVIPGGLEEKAGSEKIVQAMRKALADARAAGAGPLINGGNCLGIRSVPGKYNTLFIPEYKLPMPKGGVAPLAVISQSGAFSICRISKHPNLNPKYVITCGNQMDLTVGDYLEYLSDDRDIRVFAVYVEGFKPLDGLKTLKAAKKIADSGRSVIFYRAGRTSAGAGAAASHTASIAGDYPVTRELFSQAGATVCETLDDFDDAMTLFTLLSGRAAAGNKLGAVSNAGFECVAIADNLQGMELATFSPQTDSVLRDVFKDEKLTEIVDVHNPLDLTPMGSDDAYDRSFRAALANEGTDLGIVGLVPFTVRMNTLAADPGVHDEDVTRPDSIAGRYGDLMQSSAKPFVAVVDTGPLYDPLCKELESKGVCVFRSADRALRMLELWRKSPAARA